MSGWIPGSSSGSQILTDADDLYASHINQLRESFLSPIIVGQTANAPYSVTSSNAVSQINAAISAAAASGSGYVYVGPGVYLIDGPLIPMSNVWVYCSPRTIFRRVPGVDTIIWRVNGVDNFGLFNCEIDGNKSGAPGGATQQDIRVQDSSNLIFEGIYQHDATTHGLITKQNVSLNNNIFIGRCRFENNGTNADGSGVYINYATNVIMDGLQSSGHQLDGIQWKTSDHIQLSNFNTHSNGRYGFFPVDGHANISDGSSYGNGAQGFNQEPGEAGGNTTTAMANIDFYGNQLDGGRIADCSYIQGTNLKFWNNGQGGSTAAGLKMTTTTSSTTVSRVNITNSQFFDTQGSPTQDFGVWGSGSGTVDFNNFTDCQIFGNASTPFRQDTWGPNNTIDNVDGVNPKRLKVHGDLLGSKQFSRQDGNVATFRLIGDLTATLASPQQRGDMITLIWTQDGTGGHTLTLPSNLKRAGGSLTPTTTANASDSVTAVWNGSNWIEVGRALNVS